LPEGDPKGEQKQGDSGSADAVVPKSVPSDSENGHKTANVPNKLPKGLQAKAKAMLHEIWQAATKSEAEKAFALFVSTFQAKYPKAVECLTKDRDVLLTFYDFPAEHWIHLRTTNPIESTFSTVRLRHRRTKHSASRTACLTMVFKLTLAAEKR
jgi:transposase-like protein